MNNAYYQLIKPGIVRANIITAIAGYLFASKGDVQLGSFLLAMFAIGMVIAGGCVLNNVLDERIDALMERTKNRVLPAKRLPKGEALIYGLLLVINGSILLLLFINTITFLLGLASVLLYVALYGWVKRRSPLGTEVGTLPGAASIVAGYTAVTGQLDVTAATLFIFMVVWQMPHFLAIAIFRKEEYKRAKIPVLSVVADNEVVKRRILVYLVLLCIVAPLPYMFSYASLLYLLPTLAATLYWLYQAIATFRKDSVKWARSNFGISLVVLMVFSVSLSLSGLLT